MHRTLWGGGRCQAKKTGRCSCAVSKGLTIHILIKLEQEKCDGFQDAWEKT